MNKQQTKIVVVEQEGKQTEYYPLYRKKFLFWWGEWSPIEIHTYTIYYKCTYSYSLEEAKQMIDVFLQGGDSFPNIKGRINRTVITYP